jgi:hypothetical protein
MNHRTDTNRPVTMSTVLFALADEMRADMPPAPLPDLADLEEADSLHETACDVYDITCRELEAARDALAEAAQRLTEAEVEWSTAGAQATATARHAAGLRKAAGVVQTASGYRLATS